jgi:hypothetical protein
MFGAMAVGMIVPLLLLPSPYNFFVGLALLVIAEFGYMLIFLSRIGHAGLDRWREEVRVKLSLPAESPFAFVVYTPRRPRIWSLTVPFDGAFLAEGEDGLVILGERTRVLVPYASIKSARTELMIFNPPRRAIRLELAAGTRMIAFLEEKTFRGNRQLTEACARRIQARLEPRRAG